MHNSGSERDAHRIFLFEALSRIYELVIGNGWFLSGAEGEELEDNVSRFLKHYKWLAVDSFERGVLCWNIVSKHHLLFHIAAQGVFLNPRMSWSYQYENFIQLVIRIAKTCIHGRPMHKIGVPFNFKYLQTLYIRLSRRRDMRH